jgi:hypothetical protein
MRIPEGSGSAQDAHNVRAAGSANSTCAEEPRLTVAAKSDERKFLPKNKGRPKMRTQEEKAAAFRALHERPGSFIIPNPWEAGTAKLLAALGFEALATTSRGLANMLGCADNKLSRADVIANCQVIAKATDLPVNVDLANCFAHEPTCSMHPGCATSIRYASWYTP